MAESLPTYLTVSEADALAAKVMPMAAWEAADAEAKARALSAASERFDGARRYQGRRADPAQALEFPRRDGEHFTTDVGWQTYPAVAVAVPLRVKMAVLYEAASILAGERADALAAQHDGIASQSIGGGSESFRAPVNAQGVPTLCVDADRISRSYQLRSGRIQ